MCEVSVSSVLSVVKDFQKRLEPQWTQRPQRKLGTPYPTKAE
jgi:hypothetical protein